MDPIETLRIPEAPGLRAELRYDEYPESPRDHDCFGVMVCASRSGGYGDVREGTPHGVAMRMLRAVAPTPAEWRKFALALRKADPDADHAFKRLKYGRDYVGFVLDWFDDTGGAFCPEVMEFLDGVAVVLPLYVLEHSCIRMSTAPFNDPWDSGQVGYVYATRERVVKEYGGFGPEERKRAEALLDAEVDEYSRYLDGECYEWEVIADDADGDVLDSCCGYGDLDAARKAALHALKAQGERRTSANA